MNSYVKQSHEKRQDKKKQTDTNRGSCHLSCFDIHPSLHRQPAPDRQSNSCATSGRFKRIFRYIRSGRHLPSLNGQTVNDSNPPSVVHISMFAFNFTPVGGDATNVRIFFPTGMQSPYTWEGKVIPRGTSTYTEEIQPPYAMTSARQKDGTYALKLRIVAEEADGYVTLNFTAGENLFGTG